MAEETTLRVNVDIVDKNDASVSTIEEVNKGLQQMEEQAKKIEQMALNPIKSDALDSVHEFVKLTNDAINNLVKVRAELKKSQSVYLASGNAEGVSRTQKSIGKVEQAITDRQVRTHKVVNKFNAAAQLEGKYSSMASFNLEKGADYSKQLERSKKQLLALKSIHQDINDEHTGTMKILNRARDTRLINSDQAKIYQQSYKDITSPTGIFQKEYKSTAETNRLDAQQQKSLAVEAIDTHQTNLARLKEEYKVLDLVAGSDMSSASTKQKAMQDMHMTDIAIKETERSLQDAIDTRENYDKILEQSKIILDKIYTYSSELQLEDAKVRADGKSQITEIPHRNEFGGRTIERAFAIAMAGVAGSLYTAVNSFKQGTSEWDKMSDSSISVGNRMGNYDYRGMRREQQGAGLDYGYDGKTMLDFTDSVIGSLGETNPDQVMAMSNMLAQFTKTSGASQQTTTDLMEEIYRNGGVNNATQSKSIQNAIVGGIKASGMAGREDEQIKALNRIIDGQFAGREASEEQVKSTIALANVLSATGGKAFQGENLSGFMDSMNNTFRSAATNPYSDIGLLMGVGTNPKYSGDQGLYNYMVQMEEGATAENINQLTGQLSGVANGDFKQAAALMNQLMPTGVGTEDLAKMLESTGGQITEAQLAKALKDAEATGAAATEEAQQGYEDSSDFARNFKELSDAMIEMRTADNASTEMLYRFGGAINDVVKDFTFLSVAAVGVGSILKGIGSAAIGMISSSIVPLFTKALGKSWSASAGAESSSRITTWFSGLTGKGKHSGGSTASVDSAEEILKAADDLANGGGKNAAKAAKASKSSGVLSKASELFTESGDDLLRAGDSGGLMNKFVQGMSDIFGKFGKSGLGEIVGKAAPWLDAATSTASIAMADDKGKETMKQGGSLLGSIGAGALVGTMGGGPIGSVVGAIIGGFAGSGIGEWFSNTDPGSWITEKLNGAYEGMGDLFSTKKVSASEMTPEERSSLEEKSTTNRKADNEKQRKENNFTVAELLAKEESLLGIMQNLLDQAKAQNGIVGLLNGSVAAGSGSGSSGSGSLSYTGSGEYWTNTDIRQHDLAVTSNTLTADQLNEWINSNASENSTMYNMGQAFMDAGAASGLDPRYLVSHAALETGWGTSQYSQAGNFYGIGAFDSNPDNALKYGNGTASTGIIEGAKWIADNFYGAGQTTLDSMRNNGGTHEYATDPNWDEKIASIMQGSESYTSPSKAVTVSTNINYTATGDAEGDANNLANRITSNIANAFLKENIRA